MAKVLVIKDGSAQEMELGQELTIGRAYSNLLRLEGEEISRVHAIIYRRGNDFVVRDLDSKNGVLLNGEKISNAILGQADTIQLGNYLMLFDPPADFDLKAFLLSQNVEIESGIHTTRPTDLDTSYVFVPPKVTVPDPPIAPKASVPAESVDPVFFTSQEIDELRSHADPGLLANVAQELLTLQEMMEQGHSEADPATFSQRLLEATVTILKGDRGVLVYRDGPLETLSLGAIFPQDKDVAVNRVVLKSIFREHLAVLCNDVQKDTRFNSTETVKREKIGSLIAYPLNRKGEIFGLIYIDAISRPRAFNLHQLLLLRNVAGMLGLYGAHPQGISR